MKCMPVLKAMQSLKESGFEDCLVHTGQHYDYSMSKIFFDQLGIREPDYHLSVGSSSHGEQTAMILKKAEAVFTSEKPDMVVVYGDTNSTLGGALAAVKLHIPVVHVEAGLRSYNKKMPEEINRVLTDHSSTVLFCPTKTAVDNLRKEGFNNIAGASLPKTVGVDSPLVVNIGDVMYDTLLYAISIAKTKSSVLDTLGLSSKGYGLLTIHRAENTDDLKRLKEIIGFAGGLKATDGPIVFPMHPRTKKICQDAGIILPSRITVIEPAGYFDMLMLLSNASIALTDSGGLQKEAYWLKVPCITLREETEWVETLRGGWNVLYKDYKGRHDLSDVSQDGFGNGDSAIKMTEVLASIGKTTL